MSSSMDDSKQISEMQQNLELLQEWAFFSALPAKAIKLLAFVAERQHFSEEETIFEEAMVDVKKISRSNLVYRSRQ